MSAYEVIGDRMKEAGLISGYEAVEGGYDFNFTFKGAEAMKQVLSVFEAVGEVEGVTVGDAILEIARHAAEKETAQS